MKRIIPLDEIVPCGTKVSIGGSEWAFGDFIKQGGTGIVYAVDETRAPFRHGVIKILRPDRQSAAESFDREIVRLRERIAGERGPEFFGAGTFRGQPCVVMRRGETVPDGMGIREALRFVDDLADGLMAMKSNGYCHGDVKRINLCLFDGRAGILDLGSARRIVPDGSSEEVTYTPGYAAPEQTDGASAAPWFDVYGAAVTLNEILGQPALAVYSPAIRAGMDLRPGKRLPSAADFAAAMHDCHKEYRRQRAFSILVRVVTHSLVAALVAALFIFAHHMTTICLRRRNDMRTFRGREIQSQAEYICGEGCKALGDLSNAVQFLERALKDGYRAK